MPLTFFEGLTIPCVSLYIQMYKPLYLPSNPNTNLSMSFPLMHCCPFHPLLSSACISHSGYIHVGQCRHFSSSGYHYYYLMNNIILSVVINDSIYAFSVAWTLWPIRHFKRVGIQLLIWNDICIAWFIHLRQNINNTYIIETT